LRSVTAGQQAGQRAAIGRGELAALIRRRPDILGILRAVQPGIEVVQPPARQILGLGFRHGCPRTLGIADKFLGGKNHGARRAFGKNRLMSRILHMDAQPAPFNRDF